MFIADTASARSLGEVDERFLTTGKTIDSRRALLAVFSAEVGGLEAIRLPFFLPSLFRGLPALPMVFGLKTKLMSRGSAKNFGFRHFSKREKKGLWEAPKSRVERTITYSSKTYVTRTKY